MGPVEEPPFRNVNQFFEEAAAYLNMTAAFVAEQRLRDSVIVDHICYKCASSSDFDHLRKLLECDPPSSHFHQVFLSGRRVAYFSLRVGLPTRGCGVVRYVEICDKKPLREEMIGFHHVEIYPARMSFESLLQHLHAEGVRPVLKQRPHHTTEDVALPSGLILRFTDQPLIRKVVAQELDFEGR